MKLHEFLNQFKDLDPNMEVYGYTHSDKVCLEKKKSFHQIVFVNDKSNSYPRYKSDYIWDDYNHPKYKSDYIWDDYNREVLVIS